MLLLFRSGVGGIRANQNGAAASLAFFLIRYSPESKVKKYVFFPREPSDDIII
jgi:hypothetical protein